MSDQTPPEAIEPEPTPGSGAQPSPTTGTPPARVGGDSARELQDTVTREQPEQDPSAHGPQSGDDVREEGKDEAKDEGKGALNRVPPEDAGRIVPEPGVNERDMREHDLATHPDQLDDNPDGAGDRPRPL